ncbi:MAG: alpha/beta hydrolase [Acidimicrobiia bacterium]
MVSRRAVLGGLGATAVLGTAGITAAVDEDKLLHKLGLRNSPDHRVPVSNRVVETQTMKSAAMGKDVSWAIALPTRPPAGVVVCLHGQAEDHRFAFEEVYLHDVAADLDLDLAIAAIDGGPVSYWHPRDDGTDSMALVLDEFIPLLESRLGKGLPIALLGWSMGGYGALLFAERRPERFEAIAAASPALFSVFEEAFDGAFDSPSDFAEFDVRPGIARLSAVDVRIDCGEQDWFVDNSRSFAEKLPRPNLGRFSRGYHDIAYWRSITPDQLTTIAQSMGIR